MFGRVCLQNVTNKQEISNIWNLEPPQNEGL